MAHAGAGHELTWQVIQALAVLAVVGPVAVMVAAMCWAIYTDHGAAAAAAPAEGGTKKPEATDGRVAAEGKGKRAGGQAAPKKAERSKDTKKQR